MEVEREGNVVHVRHYRTGEGVVIAFILCAMSGGLLGFLVGLAF